MAANKSDEETTTPMHSAIVPEYLIEAALRQVETERAVAPNRGSEDWALLVLELTSARERAARIWRGLGR